MSHYFSPDPTAHSQASTSTVLLQGRRVDVATDRGVFSAGHLDGGTKILLELVPDPPPAGTFLDVGCGWGPITTALALASPRARVLGVDVNPRALDLTRLNATNLGLDYVEAHDPAALLAAEPSLVVDLIWSNPPIRVGKRVLHEILATWLPRLSPGGVAYLVANKNLGADSLHKWIETELGLRVDRIGSRNGFRVLAVSHPR